MQRGRRRCSARAATSASTCPPTSCARSSTRSSSPAAPTAPRDLPVPGRELDGIHFAMEYLTLQNRRCEGDAIVADRVHHRRRTSTSSSSAAATRAPTAWARRIVRARAASRSSSCCRGRPSARGGQPVADVAEHLPRLVRARGRRRAPLLDLDDAIQRRRDGRVTTLHADERRDGDGERPAVVRARAGQRVRAPSRSRAAGDGVPRSGAQRHARPSSACA